MTIEDLYIKQKNLQVKLHSVPDIVQMYNSATAAMVEIGEMLQEDTRWKAFTNGSKKPAHYNRANFIEELSDSIIYLINAAVYSGIDSKELEESIRNKITKNYVRFGIND